MALSMDSIMKLSSSKKILILVVVMFVIVGLYLYSFYRPLRQETDKIDTELTQQVARLEKIRAMQRDTEKFNAEVEQTRLKLAEAMKALPTEREIPDLLRKISSLGKESQLEFTVFRPKPEEAQQYLSKVPVELGIVGNYHNIGTFFDNVSKQPRIINVVDFNMSRGKETKGSDGVVVRTSCMLNTYRYIEKKTEEKKSEEKKSEQTKGQ